MRVDPIERGVRVRFRHVDGLTADWLEHLVECHLARDETIGPNGPDTKECLLAVRAPVRTSWRTAGDTLIEVRSDDDDGAAEIARRASLLTP